MKKTMISCFFCLLTVYTFGQDFCMYSQGKKVCHEVSATKFILRSNTLDATDIKNALQNMVADSPKEIIDMRGAFYIEIQNTGKGNMLEMRRQLSAREDVIYTSPVFMKDNDLEDAYTNEIFIRLKSKDDYSVLQRSAEDYSIKDIRPFELDERIYTLTLPHNPEKDAAETSIELYETGLFEDAHPSLLNLWPLETEWPDNNINIYPERTIVFYPNPVSDILYVDVENKTSASYNIRLYDSQGKMVRQTKATGGTVEFSVSNLPNGVYFLNIYDESISKPETHKIIVKH
jgi:hypothetical protein